MYRYSNSDQDMISPKINLVALQSQTHTPHSIDRCTHPADHLYLHLTRYTLDYWNIGYVLREIVRRGRYFRAEARNVVNTQSVCGILSCDTEVR